MNTSAIIRLNIERFQQMLQTESDESMRRVIENMIQEFEAMLSSAHTKGPGPNSNNCELASLRIARQHPCSLLQV